MTTFKEYLLEGIEDRGIFKSVFFAGTPGAGKTYVSKALSSGSISPRIVNTDIAFEFLSKHAGISIGQSFEQEKESFQNFFLDKAKQITKEQLAQYINGMLPLFIDSTSSNIEALVARNGILESFGYDTAMVWINTDIETALKRAATRDRHVNEQFIRSVYALADANKKYYKAKFHTFLEVDNNDGELTDSAIQAAYRRMSSFFTSGVENPIGARTIQRMKGSGMKTLDPGIHSMNYIKSHLDHWYVN
ncbi:hypothetical protein RsoM2USA_254 [Ralstonia phage RsoM2USA]|nr:hypothetical protein RsoM2USA_254 [Ralstonia phage RsoM2USA]